jgi:osmotically-inducible protein OsmY
MMIKKGIFILSALLILCLSACVSEVWTGANLIYDRHKLYKQWDDFQLDAAVHRALYHDKRFKQPGTVLDIGVLNGDVLVAGHVSQRDLWQEGRQRIIAIKGIRRFFYQVGMGSDKGSTLRDDWITTKIRSWIVADATIDPHVFKVMTVERVVYLMGDVIPSQARRVIQMARQCQGVRKVVVLFKYYHLSDKPLLKGG